ncbi:M16 family metallopeptidase [Luteimonas mephitis]|uniref:M16 family metallopeptidase n=1 Tax=Luteimonas mephitis TaxID=83615 RepID=UPI0004110CE5|nr:pitrilysin family protein [Luteimonas mephitis]
MNLMHKTLLAAAMCALLPAAALAKDVVMPKDLPAYGPDKPLPVPQIEKKTLANGLEVWVLPRDGVPRVDYVLAVRGAGFAADDAPGFATMFAGLLAEGTARHDSKAIAEAAQGYGGSLGAQASSDGVTVYGNALASNAEGMLQLLAEVARSPVFPDSEVKLAQANALQGLMAAEAQPGFKAERALAQAVYGDHPYGHTQPTEEAIKAATPEQFRDAHAKRFRPDHALLVVTGRIEPSQAFALAQSAFGDWKNTGDPVPDTPKAAATATPAFVLVQRPGSVQSAIRLGRPAIAATNPDYIPLQLANAVVGGGFSSRLMQNLREDKGYTYGARSSVSALREGGRITASADVRNEVTGASLKEFVAEYERLGSEPVPTRELDDTKRYVAGGYLISNQMQAAVASMLAGNWLVGLPPEYLGQYVPKIRAVDAAQVQAMAKKYYDPKDQSIVVVGDDKAVAEQLEPYGKFEVREK